MTLNPNSTGLFEIIFQPGGDIFVPPLDFQPKCNFWLIFWHIIIDWSFIMNIHIQEVIWGQGQCPQTPTRAVHFGVRIKYGLIWFFGHPVAKYGLIFIKIGRHTQFTTFFDICYVFLEKIIFVPF